jgi:hypothetical protein
MTCDDFDRLMADALERDAPMPAALHAHVAACPPCRATLDALDRIREMELATAPERDEEAWAGLARTLDGRLRAQVRATAPSRRRLIVLAAAAAVLVTLLTAALVRREAPVAEPVVSLGNLPATRVEDALVDAGFEDELDVDGLQAVDAEPTLAASSSPAAPWEDPVDALARELAGGLDLQGQRDLAARIAEAYPG